jgi:hypothetical protein
MGVIGFMVGALVVIIIRALQSLTPIWDPGVGLVFGTFFTAGFFVWGMGAFDPRMSAHGDEHDHEAEAAHDEPEKPTTLLIGSMWQVVFATLIGVVLVGAFAWLGPKLITTGDADASVGAIGMVPMELFGQEVLVSQLVIFAVFILFALGSLAVAAGGIGFVLNFLNRGVIEARATAGGAAVATLPAPAETRAPRPQGLRIAIFLVQFVVLFTILYLLFYYVLIGLIFPGQVLLSAVNALLFTILILRPRFVVQVLAAVSGWLAGVLRSRNNPYAGVRKNDRRNQP